jgi:hypothetical protein
LTRYHESGRLLKNFWNDDIGRRKGSKKDGHVDGDVSAVQRNELKPSPQRPLFLTRASAGLLSPVFNPTSFSIGKVDNIMMIML